MPIHSNHINQFLKLLINVDSGNIFYKKNGPFYAINWPFNYNKKMKKPRE